MGTDGLTLVFYLGHADFTEIGVECNSGKLEPRALDLCSGGAETSTAITPENGIVGANAADLRAIELSWLKQPPHKSSPIEKKGEKTM